MTLAALRELPLLAPLSDSELDMLHGQYDWAWYQPGEVMVRQGQAAGDFCIVAEGAVELLLEGDMPTRLNLLGPGDFFGELPALTGEPAPATAVAREVTSLLRLSHEGLLLLLERNSQLNRAIIAALSARAKEAGARLQRAKLRERTFADHLTRQSARAYPEWVGSGPWSQRVRAAIARAGRSIQPVIFVGEPGTGKELAAARAHYNSERKDGPFMVLDATHWSDQHWAECLRMAAHGTLLLKHAHLAPPEAAGPVRAVMPSVAGDRPGRLPGNVPRVLATAGSAEEREPSDVEAVLLDEGFAVPVPPLRERREDVPALVRHFIRKHGHLPAGARALEPVSPDALRKLELYPFLAGNVRELERVVSQASLLAAGSTIAAEHLRLKRQFSRTGRPTVGLALGGGVIRGAAHIGVIRALEEASIPVDFLAGTSSGSLVGALWAGGLDWTRIEALISQTGWLDIAEPAWPAGGFLTSRRMRGFLERQIGQVRFDRLRVPFAAVAADAGAGHEVILRDGFVADAVRASTAIPGIFKAVELDGRYLVDGVVVNNVPASVVRAMGADLVIAVDITQYSFSPGPIRSIGEAISRAFDIMARQTVTASLEWADVVIRPQVSGLNGFSTRSAPEFVRRGYAAGREAVPGILARLDQLRQEMAEG
ncbi:MAG TPA: patatin-like phospholipase family protein [Symbiobacteriaceae bacterium]|jgi:predicted acylesterase/phospholipase RssA/CRP-like cAMP-binding protein